jgi:prophage DNA circulation protein
MRQGFNYEASFDSQIIDVISSNVSHGRRVTAHTYPRKNGGNLEDTGREPLVIDLEFVFFDRAGLSVEIGDYEQRFLEFNALLEREQIRTLVHPYLGAIRCMISNFSHSADGQNGTPAIYCSATFTEEISEPPVFAAQAGITSQAGAQEVFSVAYALDFALTEKGLSTNLTAQAVLKSRNWEIGIDTSSRSVQLEMLSLNSDLQIELDALYASDDVDNQQIIRNYTLLQWQLRTAAEAYSSRSPKIVQINVTSTQPLLLISSRFYSAREASERYEELLELNPQIRNPARVEAGTTINAYAKVVINGAGRV